MDAKILHYEQGEYPIADKQLLEFAADQLMALGKIETYIKILEDTKIFNSKISNAIISFIRTAYITNLRYHPEVVDALADDDDALLDYFQDEAREYFSSLTLGETEKEEYERAVMNGLRGAPHRGGKGI